MAIAHLYTDNFEEVIQNIERPALVDFWATWCGPCRMVAPIVETLAEDYDGSLDVFKVDVDEAEDIAVKYGIMSIPTLMIFKDSKEVERVVGYRSYDELKAIIEKYI